MSEKGWKLESVVEEMQSELDKWTAEYRVMGNTRVGEMRRLLKRYNQLEDMFDEKKNRKR